MSVDPDTLQIAKAYREGQISRSDLRSYINRRYARKEAILKAPEGYYYPDASKVSEYNRQVYEYNRAINEFRNELYKAIVNAESQPQAPTQSFTPPSYAELSEQRQQEEYERQEAIQAFEEGLVSPPSPEQTERARQVRDLAIMSQSPPKPQQLEPIPGPGAGGAPGSLKERVSEAVSPKAQSLIEYMDKPFRRISGGLRETGERLREKAVGRPAEDEPLRGLAEYLGGTALGIAAAGFDVATFEARPSLWIETSKTFGALATSGEARQALVKEVARDPFSFSAQLVGGAALGTYIKRIELGEVLGRIPSDPQGYAVKPFMDSGFKLRDIRTVDEAIQYFKVSPEFRTVKGVSGAKVKIPRVLDEAIQRVKVSEITEFKTPIPSNDVTFIRELNAYLKLRPDFIEADVSRGVSGRPLFNEFRQYLKIRPDFIKPTAFTPTRVKITFLDEVKAYLKTSPAFKTVAPEGSYRVPDPKIPLSEQIKAIDKYTSQTFAAKSEAFFKSTFKEPTVSPRLTAVQLTKVETVGTPAAVEFTPAVLTTIKTSRRPTFNRVTQIIDQTLDIDTSTKPIDKIIDKPLNIDIQAPTFKEPTISLEKPIPGLKDITIPQPSIKPFPAEIQVPALAQKQPEAQKMVPLQVLRQIESTRRLPKEILKKPTEKKKKKGKKEVWELRVDKIFDKLSFEVEK